MATVGSSGGGFWVLVDGTAAVLTATGGRCPVPPGQLFAMCPVSLHQKHFPSRMHLSLSAGVSFPRELEVPWGAFGHWMGFPAARTGMAVAGEDPGAGAFGVLKAKSSAFS